MIAGIALLLAAAFIGRRATQPDELRDVQVQQAVAKCPRGHVLERPGNAYCAVWMLTPWGRECMCGDVSLQGTNAPARH